MSAQSFPPLPLNSDQSAQPHSVWTYLEKPVTGILLTIALSIMAAQLQDPSKAASFAFEQTTTDLAPTYQSGLHSGLLD